ncbi:MAG TPA: NAD(P)-binding domain-containing protein [Candidatus Saccharimonadales bacterium]|nr:NAD(P)-binding domain-containing protein [Candidatus Saccharimonadales bacterium]
MTSNPKLVIGIIGAGRLGTALAKQAISAGYSVMIANSRGPASLSLMLRVLAPEAIAGDAEAVVKNSDIVILAMPLGNYKALNPELFKGKIVIDAMNYWSPTEGYIEEFADENSSSSEYIQSYLKDSYVVKTLNHVAYNELSEHSLPPDSPDRRAVVMAGDDKNAKTTVAAFINELGFDVVDLGSLAEGKKSQPDTALFNARYTAKQAHDLAQK